MSKCEICGTEVSKLYNGVCLQCLVDRSKKEDSEKIMEENDTTGYTPKKTTEEIFAIAESIGIRRSKEEKDAIEECIDRMCDLLEFTDKERKIYHGPMKNLILGHEDNLRQIRGGKMCICKKSDFGTNCGGYIIAELGGLYLYM